CLSRCRSSVVKPGRVPSSRSAWRTHFRSVSAVQPIFSAIEVIAAHCESCAASCSRTIRTARTRTSGENRLGLVMAPSSQDLEPPGKPGRFTVEGRLVATASLQVRPDVPECGWVRWVATDLDRRREGLARALVITVLAMAGQAGCREARLHTQTDRLAA